MITVLDRLLDKAYYSGDCWEFCGARNSDGYGSLSVKGKPVSAHRIAYELLVGPIPEGDSVLHSCDNRACINPEHLFLGTQYDNVQDMINKGRDNFNSSASLTKEQVGDIRKYLSEGTYTQVKLARMYNVTPQAIWVIKENITWRDK